MVAQLVEAEGWEAFWLAAATPAEDLLAMVDGERPDVVALSTTLADAMPVAIDLLGRLRALETVPLLVVGGRAWRGLAPERVAEFGADLRVDSARELPAVLRERLPPTPEV